MYSVFSAAAAPDILPNIIPHRDLPPNNKTATAPKAEAFLVEGEAFAEFVNQKQDAIAVCFLEEAEDIKIPKIIYGSKDNSESLAQNIFSVLRDIDDKGFKTAYIHAPEKDGIGLAVYNRLIRATAFKVIKL